MSYVILFHNENFSTNLIRQKANAWLEKALHWTLDQELDGEYAIMTNTPLAMHENEIPS